MAKDHWAFVNKLATARLLGEFFLLGLVLILSPQIEAAKDSWPELVREFLGELGKAFVIAAILGWAIDRAIKNDLVRDAVSAALGYLLPERLKPELRWLYDQKAIAEQIYQVRLEHFPDERIVIFHGTVNRRLTNVSGEKITVKIGGGTDEWFHPRGESTIESCEYKRIRKDQKRTETTKIECKRSLFGIGYDLGAVDLDAEEVIELLMSYTLTMPDHGIELLTYRFLIDRPLVTLEAPKTLKAFVTFSHRDKYDEEAILSSNVSSMRLERVLLPHQHVQIHWHRADDVEKRASKYDLKV